MAKIRESVLVSGTARSDIKESYRRGVEAQKKTRIKKSKTSPNAPEAEIMRRVQFFISCNGGWYLRVEGAGVIRGNRLTPSRMTGAPDFLWLHPEHGFIGIECKSGKGGYLSSEQKSHLQRIIKAGGIALVIRSLDGLPRALDKLNSVGLEYFRKSIKIF